MDLAKSGIIGSIYLSEGDRRQDFQLLVPVLSHVRGHLLWALRVDKINVKSAMPYWNWHWDKGSDTDIDRDTYRDKDRDRDMDTTQHRNGKPLLTIHTAQLAPILPYGLLWHITAKVPSLLNACSAPSWWKLWYADFQKFIQLLDCSSSCVSWIANISIW